MYIKVYFMFLYKKTVKCKQSGDYLKVNFFWPI